MTSAAGADDVLRELRFGAAAGDDPKGRSDAARFAFTLDFDSLDRWPDVPYDTSAPSARHDAPGRARVESVLDAAACTMARRAPQAFHLVNDQLQTVLVRASNAAAGGSASHRLHVGRCLLTNLHQPREAALVAIEAVTHEAIHQLIYRAEAEHRTFCDLAEMPTFRSPWSGARLPLHSLVHASFVWYGLLRLWNALALTPASADEGVHARGRVAHCLFGLAFLEDLLDSPGFPAGSIDARVLAILREMAGAARGAARAAGASPTLRGTAVAGQGAPWPNALAASLG